MKRTQLIVVMLIVALQYLDAQIVASKKGDSGLWGFVDSNDAWVVNPQFDEVKWDEKAKMGYIQLYEWKGSEGTPLGGVINEKGKIIIPLEYYAYYWFEIEPSWPTFIKKFYTTDMDKQGLLTEDGKQILPCKYDHIYIDRNRELKTTFLHPREAKSYVGLYTSAGKQVVPCKYKNTYVQKRGVSVKDFNDNVGFYTFSGKQVVPCKYKYVFCEKGGIKVVDKDEKQGLMNDEGKEIVPCQYKCAYLLDSDSTLIRVTDFQDRQGLYSISGKKILPCAYKWVDIDVNHLITGAEFHGNNMGVCTVDGKIIIPWEFNRVMEAAEGLYLVQKGGVWKDNDCVGGKYGYYTKEGKEIIPCIYDDATIFKNDVATVKKDGEVKLIKNPLKDGSQIQIASAGTSADKKLKGPAVSRYPKPDSDVDKNIPLAKKTADNTFAFIIANENYPDAPVPYSLNDGRMFREYCQKTLGMPEKNINLYEDATYGNIITAVEKMKQVADAYEGEASVILYYAGHGFPDEKQSTAYLLPIDGNASDIITTGYSLAKLYKELAAMKLRSAVVFLDACFSGAKREDQMLSQSRGVAIKVRDEAPQGNMLVFSAAQGDETAHQLEEKHHGLFTYYLLKELQATSGDVDMGTLTEYVTKQVKRQSVVINSKKQTPTVIPSQALANNWQGLKLK